MEEEKQEDEPGAVRRGVQYAEEVVPGGEDTEVELRLSHEAGLKPDRIPKDILTAMETAGADTDGTDALTRSRGRVVAAATAPPVESGEP